MSRKYQQDYKIPFKMKDVKMGVYYGVEMA